MARRYEVRFEIGRSDWTYVVVADAESPDDAVQRAAATLDYLERVGPSPDEVTGVREVAFGAEVESFGLTIFDGHGAVISRR